jgi:hypothetical protein
MVLLSLSVLMDAIEKYEHVGKLDSQPKYQAKYQGFSLKTPL